jgi:PncC family amidohydrolase
MAGPADDQPGLRDLDDLVVQAHRLLGARRATIATAESLTGGLVAGALTGVAGSSATYRGGVVSYATDLKAALLGVDADLLRAHGAVHPQVAAAMARGARDRLEATYAVATTGVAGPEPQDGRAPGEVHVALAGPGVGPGDVLVASFLLPGDRAAVRAATVRHAVQMVVDFLGKTVV